MNKWFHASLLVGLVGLMSLPAAAATKAPAKKPAVKPAARPAIMSAEQLKGDQAKIGQEYTIGKASAVNFILNSAEFTLGRIICGESIMTPNADEKLLLLKFTVRNPQKGEINVDCGSPLSFTVVDDNNSNHDCNGFVASGVNGDTLCVTLKPAQKYDAFAAIRVPAKTDIPKLIVKSQDDLVLRYDLREKIKRLSAPFADPAASKKGVVALEEVPGQMGTPYVIDVFDVTIDSASYTKELPKQAGEDSEESEESKSYLLVNATIKNGTKAEQPFDWGMLTCNAVTEDGDNVESDGHMYYAKRSDSVNTSLKPGQDVKVRIYMEMPEGVKTKTFGIKRDNSHTYTFDVSGAS